MLSLARLLPVLLVCSMIASASLAEPPRSSRLAETNRAPSTATKIPTEAVTGMPSLPISSLLNSMYDYEVWSAPDVTGQTEWVIWGRLSNGQWEEMHRFQWTGSVDHGGWSDMGVWKFNSEYAARQQAENMMDDGKITDFVLIEQDKQPQWTYEETFDTQAEADAFADEFEDWSNEFGNPHITEVRPVLVNDIFTTQAKTPLKMTR